jgi:Protein of unknown function (DUF1573)
MKDFLYRFAKKYRLMRAVAFLFMLTSFLVSCRQNDSKGNGNSSMQLPKDSTQFTRITWLDSTERDFGSIPEGQKLEVAYRFLNSGSKPLIIARVQPSCGCTVAEQPDEPILPGKEGVIKASFNSEGRVGINHKKIYVIANTQGTQSNEVEFSVLVQKKKW